MLSKKPGGQVRDQIKHLLDIMLTQVLRCKLALHFIASNPFPTAIYSTAVAQVEDTFYVVGGGSGTGMLDTIYRFEGSDESWQLVPNRMKSARYWHTAMIVNASIFPTCD